jgi:hypothetical protein
MVTNYYITKSQLTHGYTLWSGSKRPEALFTPKLDGSFRVLFTNAEQLGISYNFEKMFPLLKIPSNSGIKLISIEEKTTYNPFPVEETTYIIKEVKEK